MRLDYIKLIDIDYGDRTRVDFGDLDDLARSIKDEGLICPIAVVEKKSCQFCSDYEEEKCADQTHCPDFMLKGHKPYVLAAGGRRFAAHKLMKLETIACNIYDHPLNELELRTIELVENIKRKKLTPEEDVALKAEIHLLQVKIHGPKFSTNADASGHSQADTAALLGVTPASLSQDLKLHESMVQFPEIQWDQMKTKADAKKIVKKIETTIMRKEGVKRAQEALGTDDTFKNKLCNSFIIRDFFEGIKEVPDNYIDLVEIDPPYAIDLEQAKKDYVYEGYNEIERKKYPIFMQKVFKSCYKKMAPNSWLICWYGPEPWAEDMYRWITEAGFGTTRMVGIWIKAKEEEAQPYGQSKQPTRRLANSYETFYYAWKGSPLLNKEGSSNGYNYPPIPHVKKTHPTERPLAMIRDVLTTFGKPGAKVLIPFLGSGNSLIAAAKDKMIPFGFELSKIYKESFIIKVNQEF
jgi:DNA modification methylase/ParB-like chromosome segregation protein Spo0J